MITRVAIYIFLWFINAVAVGDVDTVLVTLPTFLLCLFNVSRIRSIYLTTGDMFWFVYTLFFVIGPIQTLSDNYFRKEGPVFGIFFSDSEVNTAALIAFLFALAATIAGWFWGRSSEKAVAARTTSYAIDRNALPLLVVALLVSFAAVVVFSGGLGNLLASRVDKDQDSLSVLRVVAIGSQLALTFLIISIPMKTSAYRQAPSYFEWLALGVALVLLLICQNPYNTPRYFLIQAWLPVLLLFMKGRLRAMPFYVACLAGILLVLPVLSLTSRFGTRFSEALQNIDISETFFHLPYIDVFDLLVYEIRYVGDIGLSYGGRTLGALLFFVPRAIWTGKPPLIALQMGEELLAMKVAGTENLSLFFGGEFYADFALLGVAFFGLFFCWIYLRLVHNKPLLINGFRIRDFIIIAATPIVLRGPIGANAPLVFMTLVMLAIHVPIFCHRTNRKFYSKQIRTGKTL